MIHVLLLSALLAGAGVFSCHAGQSDNLAPSKFCIGDNVHIDDPYIECFVKVKYYLPTNDPYKIVREYCDTKNGGRHEQFHAHNNGQARENMNEKDFRKKSRTAGAKCARQINYMANLADGGHVDTLWDQGQQDQNTFEAVLRYPGHHVERPGKETFLLVQKAYEAQKAFRDKQLKQLKSSL